MVGTNSLIVFFVILLVIGIPSILFSLITAFFFRYIQKIKEKTLRMIVPLLVFLGILVLITVAGAGANSIVAIGLISLGTITPFPLFEKRLAEISPASTVFEASVMTFFYFLIAEFTNQVGLLRIVSDISSGSNPGILFHSVLFIEAMVIASLVYAGFTLYSLFVKNRIAKNND